MLESNGRNEGCIVTEVVTGHKGSHRKSLDTWCDLSYSSHKSQK